MTRDDLALEISMTQDIPLDDVYDVLEEEDRILTEEKKAKKKKKCICITIITTIFIMGAVAAMCILDKKQKIDMDELIKKYADKLSGRLEA